MRTLFAVVFLLLSLPLGSLAALYTVTKVDERLYAAIVDPDGPVASNAFIVVMPTSVLVAGAHFTPAASAEITRIIAGITPLPLRYVVLTHHHQGKGIAGFGFPPTVEIILSAESFAKIREEKQPLSNRLIAFEKVMTLSGGKQTILLMQMDQGHSRGNLAVYLPDQAVLFTSDLMFNDEAGSMTDGSPRGWVQDLLQLEKMVVTKVVPGRGNVTGSKGIRRFRLFLQDFFTEVLSHLERGESAAETVARFGLPPEKMPPHFFRVRQENIEWAWRELREQR